MSRKTVRKQDIHSFATLKSNKYFRTVLVAYYMLTRNEDVIQVSNKLKDEKLLEKIFDEYKLYVAGCDINISITKSETPTFKVPDYTIFKASSLLQILRRAPKI